MTFNVFKGWHYAIPLYTWFWWNKKIFIWKVKFTDSCLYDLQSDDQLDTNKLCGVGYFPGLHHVDSARFGWRYVKETDGIELLAYCYANKQRIILPITTIAINKTYTLQLSVNFGSYFFKVTDERGYARSAAVAFFHKKKLQYFLTPFFGGNRRAPHKIKIKLSKV
jgi:hypothetical protein